MLVRSKDDAAHVSEGGFRRIVRKHIKSLPRRSMKLRVDEAVNLLFGCLLPLRSRDVGVEGW